MMQEKPPVAEETRDEQVRPGLEMRTGRTRKEDGRYLIYYDFRRGEPPVGTGDPHE